VKLSSLIENSDVFSQAQHPRDMTSSAKLFKCFAVSILTFGDALFRVFEDESCEDCSQVSPSLSETSASSGFIVFDFTVVWSEDN